MNATRWILLVPSLLALAAAGCGTFGGSPARAEAASKATPVGRAGLVASDFDVEVAQAAEVGDTASLGGTAGPAAVPPPGPQPIDADTAAPERLLVRKGRFAVAVGSVEEALDGARRAAEELGGYVQAVDDVTVTLRVPADRWDDALARLRSLGRILSRAIEVEDVTEEVVDLRLRLRNARALLARLEELLARAQTVEETLKVETELNRVRTEVEQLEGRLSWLANRVALATLVVRFVPAADAPVRPEALPFAWLRGLGIESLLGLTGGAR